MPYSTIDDDTGLNKSGSQSVAIANSFSVCPKILFPRLLFFSKRINMESSIFLLTSKKMIGSLRLKKGLENVISTRGGA